MSKRVLPAILIIVVTIGCVAASEISAFLFFVAATFASVWEMNRVLRHADKRFFVNICYLLVVACGAGYFFGAGLLYDVACFFGILFLAFLGGMIKPTLGCEATVNTLFVMMYPLLPFMLILKIVAQREWMPVLLLAIVGVWVCDSAALAGGKKFGRHKVAPLVSPQKTVEGCIAGAIGSLVVGLVAFLVYHKSFGLGIVPALVTSLVCTTFGQVGDLAASLVKRMADVKDYSNLLPEHGGVMDKMDSMLFAIPTAWLCLHLFGLV